MDSRQPQHAPGFRSQEPNQNKYGSTAGTRTA
jgi:hypothetical protein